MTAAAEVVVAVLVIGAAELGVASAKTLALIAVVALVMAPLLVLHWHLGRKTTVPLLALPPVPPCPCCTAAPYTVDDCTCREDCGSYWCQMKTQCPWCDTHECIDRTLCNCTMPCGSWLCEKREASCG